MSARTVLAVAVATPLMRRFDYLAPTGPTPAPRRGQRIRVPFGRTQRIGIVCRVGSTSDIAENKLRHAIEILDRDPLLDDDLMALLEWAANYYHHPPGEVFSAALPGALRRGGPPVSATERAWRLTGAGRATDAATVFRRAKVQRHILESLHAAPDGLADSALSAAGTTWRRAAGRLEQHQLIERFERDAGVEADAHSEPLETGPTPTEAQQTAIAAISAARAYECFLLEGVTGSGKTEVYLRAIGPLLDAGRQALVIVPEIGLTPQLVDRFRRRLRTRIAVLHSGLTDAERLDAWCAARSGDAGVIIGTRSAVFAPLARPGLIVIDEEHDASLKQQEGFRYSARDLAVWRARRLDIPIVLGSATPSFESLANVRAGRYTPLILPGRPGDSRQPDVRLIDLRHQPAKDGLTEPMRVAIARHLAEGGQVLIYLNRRGYAPGLLCTACGALAECRRCDARLVLHRGRNRLICHHCGAERRVPEACDTCKEAELVPVGQGTERLETALGELFPDQRIVRIDRDTTRRRGEIERRLAEVHSGNAGILLGTQMLTKGHDFPGVTLVGIVDADQGLFGTDFRAGERLAQSFVQVSGRAGRGQRAGEVFIQTLFPDHPLLNTLLAGGYHAFAEAALEERRRAGWPPFTCLSLLRAESPQRESVYAFLNDAAHAAHAIAVPAGATPPRVLGPAPAPMERRAGRYRGQLLIHCDRRGPMQRFVYEWRTALDQLPSGRQTRWSIDVDPVELF